MHDARREEGQILPVLAMVVLTLFAAGFMLLQAGHATIVRAEATTIADAAALAAADNLAEQMRANLHTTAFNEATALDHDAAENAARTYAQRNGGSLQRISFDDLTVTVEVVTDDALSGQGFEPSEGPGGQRGVARAQAEVEVIYAFAPPDASVGGGTLDPDEIARISDEAGVPVPPYSVLLDPSYYGNGNGGPSVNLLAPQMKAAIARLETAMGTKLLVTSGYRSAAYQAELCQRVSGPCAPPGRSMHQYGLAVDVSNWAATLPYLEAAGLCQPLPMNDAVHLSHVSGRECGGQTGVLGSGTAGVFGGDPASYATFEVHLID